MVDLAKAEAETCEDVELPVGIVGILAVEVVVEHGGVAFEVEVHAFAKTEVKVQTEAAGHIVALVPIEGKHFGTVVGSDAVLEFKSLVVAEAAEVSYTTGEPEGCETVGLHTAENGGKVEHTVKTYLCVVILVVFADGGEYALACPSATVEAEGKVGVEAVTYGEGCSGRHEVAETAFTTGDAETALNTDEPV